MPLSRSRDYLSIGEVLETLQEEFPDVSISKIRFLESEGLIEPKRTPSGYRMFFDKDLSRLRWILTMQRDHFLPLKVIKERIEGGAGNGEAPAPPAAAPPSKGTKGAKAAPAAVATPPPPDLTTVQLFRPELLKSAGLTERQLADLEEYGIVATGEGGNYDGAALSASRAAKRFFDYGVEARHLKMYRQFAEREVAFFEQIVLPVSRRRDPAAQKDAARSVRELAGLARQMRDAALHTSLQELL